MWADAQRLAGRVLTKSQERLELNSGRRIACVVQRATSRPLILSADLP
jgi:hypothetical protein